MNRTKKKGIIDKLKQQLRYLSWLSKREACRKKLHPTALNNKKRHFKVGGFYFIIVSSMLHVA